MKTTADILYMFFSLFNVLVAGLCLGRILGRRECNRTKGLKEPSHGATGHACGIVAPADAVIRAAPRGKGKVYVTLQCGAEILELEPGEVTETPAARDGNQPESVREGGVFFQCYARCPFVCDCPYFKAFAEFHLGEDFALPLEHGRRLELQRDNGHRRVALVDYTDVDVKAVPLAGVSYYGRLERYTTVPPLFQDVEEPSK